MEWAQPIKPAPTIPSRITVQQATFSLMHGDELLTAGDRNLAFVLRHFTKAAPDGVVHDDGRLLMVSGSLTWPGPYHNGALRLDPSLEPKQMMEQAERFFTGLCPGYCLWVAAHVDGCLEEQAEEAGYVSLGEGIPRMAITHPLSLPRPPDGVRLEEVDGERGWRAYLAVTLESYADVQSADATKAHLSEPKVLLADYIGAVVAYRDGSPSSAAMVVASDGIASVQYVGTVPAARRSGLGELCTQWAVNRGFDLGASAVVLEASDMGAPVYLRMGFVERSRYRFWFGPPTGRST